MGTTVLLRVVHFARQLSAVTKGNAMNGLHDLINAHIRNCSRVGLDKGAKFRVFNEENPIHSRNKRY